MYAVIVTGGAQHRVSQGDVLKVARLVDAEPGATVELAQVLAVGNGSDLRVGSPTVEEARVTATVLSHGRGPKIRVFKKKRRKHYRRTRGHRQDFSEIRIDSIVSG